MIICHAFKDKRVAVFGLGKSGLSAAHSLLAGGAKVHAWDDNEQARAAAEQGSIPLEDLYKADWTDYAALILAPGVPLTHPKPHPVVNKAKKHEVEILGDVELFARTLDEIKHGAWPKVIAVTGTNGKSTTTALIAHILNCCGLDAQACGNIGNAILDLPMPTAHTAYVIEMSSYQIDLTKTLKPDIAVFLNLTPDHLDRHGDMAGYIGAKTRIFDQQGDGDFAVICVDDAYTQEICTQISARNRQEIIPAAVGKALGRGIYVIDGVLYDGIARPTTEISDLRDALALPGSHNWQNAAAAFAATRIIITDSKGLGQAILSFPGLAHRLEDVGRIGNVRFINDSKATNAEAALYALSAFDNIYWIVGGQSKRNGITSLRGQLAPVVKAYLIGESAEAFSRTLNGEVAHEMSGELKDAVAAATRDALASGTQNPVVLLSPACASFDQFSDFEDRGNAFRATVATLKANQGTQSTSQGESAA